MKKLLSTARGEISTYPYHEERGVLTGRVNRRSGLPRVLGNLRLVLGESGGPIDGRVGATTHVSQYDVSFTAKVKGNVHGDLVGSSLGRALAVDESLPCFIAFMDDLDGVLLSLGFTVERKDVLPETRISTDST